MIFDQHLYTRTEKGLATSEQTGLDHQELMSLESRSVYILPDSLLYQENPEVPQKYVYYPLSDKLVFGCATYIGKDQLGRPGNYLFHNLLIDKETFTDENIDPATFMKQLIVQDAFLTEPKTGIKKLELKIEYQEPGKLADNQLLSLLAGFTLDVDLGQIVINGQNKRMLDLLSGFFALLPEEFYSSLSFDTYSYGTVSDYLFSGLPSGNEFEAQASAFQVRIDTEGRSLISDGFDYKAHLFKALKSLPEHYKPELELCLLKQLLLQEHQSDQANIEIINKLPNTDDKELLIYRELLKALFGSEESLLLVCQSEFKPLSLKGLDLLGERILDKIVESDSKTMPLYLDCLFQLEDFPKGRLIEAVRQAKTNIKKKPLHDFAQNMLEHSKNINTEIRSVVEAECRSILENKKKRFWR